MRITCGEVYFSIKEYVYFFPFYKMNMDTWRKDKFDEQLELYLSFTPPFYHIKTQLVHKSISIASIKTKQKYDIK